MRILLLLLPIAAILLAGCNKCPRDQKLGGLALQTSTKSLIPYRGGETLVFVSDQGEEISFKLPNARNLNEAQMLVVEVPCSKGSFLFPKETLIYYEAEQFGLYTASDDSQIRTLLVNAIMYNDRFGSPEDTLLYELVTVTAQFDEEVASFQMLGSDRGNPEVHLEHPDGFDNFQMLGDTSLLGRPFTQVLQNMPATPDGSLVFYNTQKGLIGVKTLNRMWVLDRGM